MPGAICIWSAFSRPSLRFGSGAIFRKSNRQRHAARDRMRQGAVLQGEDAAIVRFTLVDMFADPAVRSRLILTFVMSLSVTIGYIGASRVSFRAMSDQSPPLPGL